MYLVPTIIVLSIAVYLIYGIVLWVINLKEIMSRHEYFGDFICTSLTYVLVYPLYNTLDFLQNFYAKQRDKL